MQRPITERASQSCILFLTAKGKGFYKRLKDRAFLAFTGMKGEDTMSCTALSIRGKVRELGSGLLLRLFAKNPYMAKIYPTEQSRAVLTVFQIYEGSGEWFDLSRKPIQRAGFTFGDADQAQNGYFISEKCVGCGKCVEVCPQNCINLGQAVVPQQIKKQSIAIDGDIGTILQGVKVK